MFSILNLAVIKKHFALKKKDEHNDNEDDDDDDVNGEIIMSTKNL